MYVDIARIYVKYGLKGDFPENRTLQSEFRHVPSFSKAHSFSDRCSDLVDTASIFHLKNKAP